MKDYESRSNATVLNYSQDSGNTKDTSKTSEAGSHCTGGTGSGIVRLGRRLGRLLASGGRGLVVAIFVVLAVFVVLSVFVILVIFAVLVSRLSVTAGGRSAGALGSGGFFAANEVFHCLREVLEPLRGVASAG